MALGNARAAIESGQAKRVLVVVPEIGSAQLNFRDRHSHFSLGDGCCALLLEARECCRAKRWHKILDQRLVSLYSNNIANQFGVLGRCNPDTLYAEDKWLQQRSGARFNELEPLVTTFANAWLSDIGLAPENIAAIWLQQSSWALNQRIGTAFLKERLSEQSLPSIMQTYGDLASAGALACFHLHKEALAPGEQGILLVFGSGYNLGCMRLEAEILSKP